MVILLLALAFSVIFVVTGILIIFGLLALSIGFFYYNITDGSLVTALWIIPVLLVLVIAILIILGWLSVIPPKFNGKEKTSFKLRVFNIIILALVISLMTAFFCLKISQYYKAKYRAFKYNICQQLILT